MAALLEGYRESKKRKGTIEDDPVGFGSLCSRFDANPEPCGARRSRVRARGQSEVDEDRECGPGTRCSWHDYLLVPG